MDRTLRKSQTRNNDGERQMISLLEIAQNINEADVDDDKIIKYKDKEGESQEMTAGAAKRQPDDHPAKVAYNKMADKGGDSEKDSGGKLGGSDFDRDAQNQKDADDWASKMFGAEKDKVMGKDDSDGGDEPDMDSDDDMDDDKNASERENEKIEKELQNIAKDKGLTVGSEEANYGGEIHSLVGKDDDPDNTLGFHAAPNFDDDGNMTDEPQYAIELGMGSSPMYFGSKEEADSALQKIVDDERIRKAMDGEGGETLFDLGDHAKSIVKDKGEPKAQDPYNPQGMNPNDPMFYDPQADAKRRKRAMNASKDIKMINGKKYKPIKEGKKSKKHILKENYDRFFGDKK